MFDVFIVGVLPPVLWFEMVTAKNGLLFRFLPKPWASSLWSKSRATPEMQYAEHDDGTHRAGNRFPLDDLDLPGRVDRFVICMI